MARTSVSVLLLFSLLSSPGFAQQTDTSSYFPLGFWGIWIDRGTPPLNQQPIDQFQWNREINSWRNINGNYLVHWIPEWVEDTVLSVIEPLGYRLDIARSKYPEYNDCFGGDTSVQWLVREVDNTDDTQIRHNESRRWA